MSPSVEWTECFLAERFLPRSASETLERLIASDRAAAHAMSMDVLGTIYVPDDETCFTLLAAPRLGVVTQASNEFHLAYNRVLAAISIRSGVAR
jgi:hypothetical protein